MRDKPQTVVLYESVLGSIVSDVFTFAVTAGLVLLADGRSFAWQIITAAMFMFWVAARAGIAGKIHKFYSKRELIEWAQSLPDKEKGPP
jgi:hypothetical protein